MGIAVKKIIILKTPLNISAKQTEANYMYFTDNQMAILYYFNFFLNINHTPMHVHCYIKVAVYHWVFISMA